MSMFLPLGFLGQFPCMMCSNNLTQLHHGELSQPRPFANGFYPKTSTEIGEPREMWEMPINSPCFQIKLEFFAPIYVGIANQYVSGYFM